MRTRMRATLAFAVVAATFLLYVPTFIGSASAAGTPAAVSLVTKPSFGALGFGGVAPCVVYTAKVTDGTGAAVSGADVVVHQVLSGGSGSPAIDFDGGSRTSACPPVVETSTSADPVRPSCWYRILISLHSEHRRRSAQRAMAAAGL